MSTAKVTKIVDMKSAHAHDAHMTRVTSFTAAADIVEEVDDVTVPDVGVVHVPVVKGQFKRLPAKVQEFIATYVSELNCGFRWNYFNCCVIVRFKIVTVWSKSFIYI